MSDKQNSLLISDARIFTGETFIESGFVLVQDGKITQVDSGACSNVPDSVRVLRATGCTLLPGLIDAHVHGLFGNVLCIEQSLRFGVTTVCDMHTEAHHIRKLKDVGNLAASDPSRYADFKCAGVGAIISGGWPEPVVLSHGRTPQAEAAIASWPKLKDPTEAEPFVEEQIKECGASYIKLFHEVGDTLGKSFPTPSLELQRAVIDAAHARNMLAVGHAFSYRGAMDLLEAGADGLTHIFMDKPPSDGYIALCRRNGAHVNPTLSTVASQSRESDEMQEAFAADPLAQRMLADKTPRKPLAMGDANASVENAYESTKALYQAGVPIIVGSDASGQPRGSAYGMGVHMEMYLLTHKIGMAPVDVLRAATSVTADRFGFQDRGKIEVGRKADLVLVEGDVVDILTDEGRLCLPIRGVWRDGVLASVYEGTLTF